MFMMLCCKTLKDKAIPLDAAIYSQKSRFKESFINSTLCYLQEEVVIKLRGYGNKLLFTKYIQFYEH